MSEENEFEISRNDDTAEKQADSDEASAEPSPMRYSDIVKTDDAQAVSAEGSTDNTESKAYINAESRQTGYSIADDELILPQFTGHKISKKVLIVKSLAWMLSVIIVSLGIFLIFRFTSWNSSSGNSRDDKKIPDNNLAASSYAEDISIPEAPSVSADPDGPQISTASSDKEASTNPVNAAFKKASPSVVCVTSYKGGQDYVLNKIGDGSGVIISDDGYIATNSHVVDDDTSTGVLITVYDGTQYLGTIIGVDKKTDLAVLKIDAKGLTAAEFADSDALYVGQEVYAIGSPGGSNFTNSLTKGTVSATNRILSSNAYIKYIQTDAAINPGNSGGPLINENGQVVGMNTSKIITTNYEGMGFSIPSNKVAEIINKLIKYGYINDRGTLGIEGVTCNLYESKSKNVPMGMVITRIDVTSPLYLSNVNEQDIITAVNGERVRSSAEFIDKMGKYKPGDTIVLTLFRAASGTNKKEYSFDQSVTLIEDSSSVS